jgi:hypothetical protein
VRENYTDSFLYVRGNFWYTVIKLSLHCKGFQVFVTLNIDVVAFCIDTMCCHVHSFQHFWDTCWPRLRGQHGCGESVGSLGRQDDTSCGYSDTIWWLYSFAISLSLSLSHSHLPTYLFTEDGRNIFLQKISVFHPQGYAVSDPKS